MDFYPRRRQMTSYFTKVNLQISPIELAEKLRLPHPPRLLDVREQDEHDFAALPHSTLIPVGQLTFRAEEIAAWKDEEIVVYCHHGIRSLQAIGQLKHFGFTRLQNLTGGIDRWSREVEPGCPRY